MILNVGETIQPSGFGLKGMNQVFVVYYISYGQHAIQWRSKPRLWFAGAEKQVTA
jgi:hypothetical protein